VDQASLRKTAAANQSQRTGKTSVQDHKARLEAIVRGENALVRNRSLLALIDQLAPGEFEAAVAHFRSLGLTEDRMGEYALLLTAWAELDPTAALIYARENTQNGFATETILSAWATKDSEAAVRWAQANHQGDGANPYMPGIIRGIAASDPARATAALQVGEAPLAALPAPEHAAWMQVGALLLNLSETVTRN
jgi:hypothetical protein